MESDMMTQSPDRLGWFRDARFGMMITWGLHSIPGRGEWTMVTEAWPVKTYAKLARRFNPKRFDADQWADLAVAAGMKYGVMITRHCDGYCLFDSDHSVGDFTSSRTAAGRDFVRAYVEAFRKRGLRVGLYYSLADWREPGMFDPARYPQSARRMVDSAHRQVEELMTSYGRIDILWYDGWYWEWCRNKWPGIPRENAVDFWRSAELNAMVRRHQPHILINDRSGLPEDFTTPEQRIQASEQGRAWETCMTIGHTGGWGYIRHDPARKTVGQLIHCLVEAVSIGGNFLLNVGPKPDGTIRCEELDRLRAIGVWLEQYGEAVYGRDLIPLGLVQTGFSVARGNSVYLMLCRWPGREAIVPDLATPVKDARLLGSEQALSVHTDANRRTLLRGLPTRPPNPYVNVIVMTCTEPPRLIQEAQPCWWPE